MAYILCLETATPVCSVALTGPGGIVARETGGGRNDHSAQLTLMTGRLMAKAGLSLDALDAVAVSKGPGSYTGLRIGVSTAKGFCYALGKPLIGVDTLQSMAAGMAGEFIPPEGTLASEYLFCPMIDARRMEVYSAIYDFRNQVIRAVCAEIIDDNSFRDYLEQNRIVFSGDGAAKTREVLQHNSHAVYMEDFEPSAAHMAEIAEKYYDEGKFEDVAYFEPFYLKDFIAGTPKVKGLR